jgi:uncharacterized membrane protein YdjX (TVP38/TMEM64 family)
VSEIVSAERTSADLLAFLCRTVFGCPQSMEVKTPDHAAQSSWQPKVPDSRLPGVEPPSPSGSEAHAKLEGEMDDYDISALALWPVFAMCLIALTVTLATVWYGPSKVLHVMLKYLVPEKATSKHMYGIYFAIVGCITLGIPVLLLLLPVPTLMFGFCKGFFITFSALMTAAVLSFIIGRYVAQRPVRRFLQGRKCERCMRLLSVLEDDESQSMQLLILYRFLTIPFALRNYGPSILRVPMVKLVISAVPHSLWSATVFAVAGSALKGPATHLRDGNKIEWSTPHWLEIVGLGVAGLSMLFFSWIAWRAYSEKANVEENLQSVTSSSALKGGQSAHYGTNAEGVAVVIQTSDF